MIRNAILTVIFIISHKCYAGISYLNESDYYRMPALYALDEYRPCLAQSGGLYCVVDAILFAEPGNELMQMIQEYSAIQTKHFNHTQIHRGICVTQTCKQFITYTDLSIDRNRDETIEKCLSESVSKQFGLQVKLAEVRYCNKSGQTQKIDEDDRVVKTVYAVIILLSIIGTVSDKLLSKKKNQEGNSYLIAFSIPRNWKKLTAPSGGLDPRLNRLQSLNGIRTVVMIGVIFCHAEVAVSMAYVQNPLRIEKAYGTLAKQLLLNGPIITFSFIAMSSFLLAYNLQIYSQGRELRLIEIPKGIFLRWLRLTPSYALVLATAATYLRHAGSGPMWDLLVTPEVEACRTYWWAHLLYIQNYFRKDVYCIPQAWYLAVDTQLFSLGLTLLVVVQKPAARKVVLSALFGFSLCVVAAQTYVQDLDALVVQTPENLRSLYAQDDTFRKMYILGHTNISSQVMGLAAGLFGFHLQSINRIEEYCKKYCLLTWLLLPLGFLLALTGKWSYLDEGRPSLVFRVLYATFYKCFFVLIMLAFIISAMFKVESWYRGLAEWRGFTWMSRVTYNAFLVHHLFQKVVVGTLVAPIHASAFFSIMFLTSSVVVSYGLAVLLYIFVEAPVGAITKKLFMSKEKKPELNEDNPSKFKLNELAESKKCNSKNCNSKCSHNNNEVNDHKKSINKGN